MTKFAKYMEDNGMLLAATFVGISIGMSISIIYFFN